MVVDLIRTWCVYQPVQCDGLVTLQIISKIEVGNWVLFPHMLKIIRVISL